MKVSNTMNSTRSAASSRSTKTFSSGNGAHDSGASEPLRLLHVAFQGDSLIARFVSGAAVTVNLKRYPRLRRASPAQRKNWRLTGKGLGIHWEEIDEDLSVENLLFAAAKTNLGARAT